MEGKDLPLEAKDLPLEAQSLPKDKQEELLQLYRAMQQRGDVQLAAAMRLATPWGEGQMFDLRPQMEMAERQLAGEFLKTRTHLHEVYIMEQEKTKRIGLLVACVLMVVAATVLVIAPQGRETVANWMGAALVVSAAGAVGFSAIRAKSAVIEVEAGRPELRDHVARPSSRNGPSQESPGDD